MCCKPDNPGENVYSKIYKTFYKFSYKTRKHLSWPLSQQVAIGTVKMPGIPTRSGTFLQIVMTIFIY